MWLQHCPGQSLPVTGSSFHEEIPADAQPKPPWHNLSLFPSSQPHLCSTLALTFGSFRDPGRPWDAPSGPEGTQLFQLQGLDGGILWVPPSLGHHNPLDFVFPWVPPCRGHHISLNIGFPWAPPFLGRHKPLGIGFP